MLEYRIILVNVGSRLAAYTLMGSAAVTAGKARLQLLVQVMAVVGGIQVNVPPLSCAPEALYEGIIAVARPWPSRLMQRLAPSNAS